MEATRKPAGTGRFVAVLVISSVASALASAGVLMLLDIEMKPPIVAAVVGAATASAAYTFAHRERGETQRERSDAAAGS